MRRRMINGNWRGGRAVECTGLENQQGFVALRGFESLPLRQILMKEPKTQDLTGGCACGDVRYQLTSGPLFVHCCHCHWCQRESGSAFALNALIETDRVEVLQGEIELVPTPTESGKGQDFARCPACKITLWSHYAGMRGAVAFIRVGTLDNPDLLPPDIHIFVASKQPWVILPDEMPAVDVYYDRKKYWPQQSIDRHRAVRVGPA